jgi:hypothetical protein
VIFLLFTPIGYLLYVSGDVKIRIPDTFVGRFSIPAFCYRTSEEFRELLDYLFADGNLSVVKVGMGIPEQQVLRYFQPYVTRLWTLDDILLHSSITTEGSDTQTKCVNGYVRLDDVGDHCFNEILLVLAAGRNRDGEIEKALQLLRQKGYRIKAAMLWQPDLRLLADYYTLSYELPGD